MHFVSYKGRKLGAILPSQYSLLETLRFSTLFAEKSGLLLKFTHLSYHFFFYVWTSRISALLQLIKKKSACLACGLIQCFYPQSSSREPVLVLSMALHVLGYIGSQTVQVGKKKSLSCFSCQYTINVKILYNYFESSFILCITYG